MEALYYFKFLRTNNNKEEDTEISNNNVMLMDDDDGSREGDEAFFELEFPLPYFYSTTNNNKTTTGAINAISEEDNYKTPSRKPQQLKRMLGNKAEVFPSPPPIHCSVFPSKRKVLPVEPIPKPQSPVSLLKSAPKLSLFLFNNPKMATQKTDKSTKKQSKVCTVDLAIEESTNGSMFSRENSCRKRNPDQNDTYCDSSLKRSSKNVMQRYLNLIKPLYVKVSKRNIENFKFPTQSSVTSSPAVASVYSPRGERQGSLKMGFRTVSKHFGKSKSASAASSTPFSPANRRDDSLLQMHDGIQGAILHCKRSFNSTRDSSLLSWITNDQFPGNSTEAPRRSA